MGSNMAECHPVGFQWVVEAQHRGAKVIHVDPRFTRTSALADLHVPIRAGSDIAFLGGLVNHILQNGREFREYVQAYTNAAMILRADFRDTEDLDGLFSGWDDATGAYDPTTWEYEGPAPASDPALEHPRCVFQVLKRHFSRYTPEMVEDVCGAPRQLFLEVADALCENSGRERTSAFCYSVGWTQHSVGVQYIRTAAIVQLLLGNVGRPGGGILALRGHASIQGSTDIPTLYNLLPGYLPMPHAHQTQSLQEYVERNSLPGGYWGHTRDYLVSLLKAWWGDAATAENDYCFDHLPRIDGDHSTYASVQGMLDGQVKGFFVAGENPAIGSANGRLHRLAFAQLDWMVVRDLVEVETASFWLDSPEVRSGELRTADIGTEVFFLPAAAHTEKDGTFTNTQRLLQWHTKAVEPQGDCRSELWFYFHLGLIIREKLAGSREASDRALLDLTWDYPREGPLDEPEAGAVLREINGRRADGRMLSSFPELRDDGSTACGCWIYCGSYADDVNQTARRRPAREQTWVAPEWGWAWPANRRLLYNRASADPEGNPWSERKRYVWWDEARSEWTGADVPDFPPNKPPDYVPPPGAHAEDAHRGDEPFVMQSDGRGWLYAPRGLLDGPLPTHYEPHESVVGNRLYGMDASPTRQLSHRPENRYNDDGERYPYVVTTYRLTEHHTAGGMSRFVGRLAELQPEPFCEVSPALASERGLVHGEWATVSSARGAIEVRVLVTDRIRPLTVQGRAIHQVGLPYHWGWRGISTGDAANDLFPLVLDPNVHIQEVKAATCDIRAGRRYR
jgi:formate dehydrogenase major subunit